MHRTPGARAGLVLTHGAGSDCRAPLLVAVASAFAQAGLTVLRCDLPFRQARLKGPPHPSKAEGDRAGLRAAVEALHAECQGDIYLGGHSYGGRQASMLAAEDPSIARALLLLSYPLHPPAKPEQMRTAHFPGLRTRAVFVQGVTDPFATAEEMQQALKLIPAATTLLTIDKAGHDLRYGRFDLAPVIAALTG
ncbi:MAG TPA: alpha/beta family hydrolase [Burkholderiales bacterium]|nr:alpha/beta family hydrolase [Burkholderiales bacterium]